MTIKKKHIYNLLFWGFIIFLFTPYGLGTRAKLTQGVLYIKGMVFSPSAEETSDRISLDTYNVAFDALANAENVNLSDLKGKIVFINHWATWCPPCRAEMPSLHNLYKDYADKIEFIFLTTDPKTAIDKYYTANDFSFPTYMVSSAIPQQINTASLPTTVILDKEGKVFLKELGAADWNSGKVRKMLDELLVE